jgi:hypothetical protein
MSGPVKSAAEIQRGSDVIKLTAAIHGVNMLIGEERFAAAFAGLPASLPPRSARAARIAPAAAAHNLQDAEQGSIDDTLALARAAGIGRFAAVEVGSAPDAAKPQAAEMDTLALIRASGLKGYDVGRSA